MKKLDRELVLGLLKPGGGLSKCLPGYEPRLQQEGMTENVVHAFNNGSISLIEAGTGTGKSLAYLIPAAIKALYHKEPVLVSTRTINLQQQLLEKDIPIVEKLIGKPIRAVLLKGMGNYLCKRKLADTLETIELAPDEEKKQLRTIAAWGEQTKEGSKSELPFLPYSGVWEQVNAENDTCSYRKCPHYQECHFFKAREKAATADLLLVNHHLLFADISFRASTENWDEPALLPSYQHVILDEAHHIEDVATEFFAARTSRTELLKTMGKIASEKGGKIPLLKKKFHQFYGEISRDTADALSQLFNSELPQKRGEVLNSIHEFFQSILYFFNEHGKEEGKLRLRKEHMVSPNWQGEVVREAQTLLRTLGEYAHLLKQLLTVCRDIALEPFQEQVGGVYKEIEGYAARLNESSKTIGKFVFEELELSTVRWFENFEKGTLQNTHLVSAQLDIATFLAEHFFAKLKTMILCSATMTSEKSFSFMRDRLGLEAPSLAHRLVTEHIYESPFNYKKQCLLSVPIGISDPSSPKFIEEASEQILKAVRASRGGAFVLFTSYSMMQQCFERIAPILQREKFSLFKQGEEQRQELLNRFRKGKRAVLLATDSFWEGVDVVGNDLKLVILVKLPFKVPSEPIVEGRTEWIRSKGKDPFRDFSLPLAIVKFKQGFGRLIRHRNDRGVVLVLDHRIMTKNYGKKFLNSLPPLEVVSTDDVKGVVEAFFHENSRIDPTRALSR